MPVKKRKNPSGHIVWMYKFEKPGSTRADRRRAWESGFATKGEAVEAESQRRTQEQVRYAMEKGGVGVTAAAPTSLGGLLQEFLRQHSAVKLAAKTHERYKELAAYLDPGLAAMQLKDVTPFAPQQRVGPPAPVRRPYAQDQGAARDETENRPAHRGPDI
jgi:hypothetical protein